MSAWYDGAVRRRHLLTSVHSLYTGYVVAPAASGGRDAWCLWWNSVWNIWENAYQRLSEKNSIAFHCQLQNTVWTLERAIGLTVTVGAHYKSLLLLLLLANWVALFTRSSCCHDNVVPCNQLRSLKRDRETFCHVRKVFFMGAVRISLVICLPHVSVSRSVCLSRTKTRHLTVANRSRSAS